MGDFHAYYSAYYFSPSLMFQTSSHIYVHKSRSLFFTAGGAALCQCDIYLTSP